MLGKPAAICACAGREKANFATTPHLSPPGRPPGGISPQAQRPACSQQHRRLFSAEREAPSPPEPPARASPRGGGGGGWVEVSLEPPAPAPRGASVPSPPPPALTHSLTHHYRGGGLAPPEFPGGPPSRSERARPRPGPRAAPPPRPHLTEPRLGSRFLSHRSCAPGRCKPRTLDFLPPRLSIYLISTHHHLPPPPLLLCKWGRRAGLELFARSPAGGRSCLT